MAKRHAYFDSVHYTLYLRLDDEQRRDIARAWDTRYAAGRGLARLKAGDVVWWMNVHQARLYLVGRLKVSVVTTDTTLAQELVNSDMAWRDADAYAIADRRDAEPPRLIDITQRTADIIFADEAGRAPLPLAVQRWQSLRALTDESAELVNGLWSAYEDEAAAAQDYVDDYLELTEDDRAHTEGRLVMRTQQERLRNRTLVRQAKQRHRRRDSALACQACGFSFAETYGVEYIEAHHAQQMASFSGEQQTRVEDLCLLCANCHRVVHSQTPPLTIDQLRGLLHARRAAQPETR